MNNQKEIILAIDVSSTQLEAYISNGESVILRKAFSNSRRGCNTLFKTARELNVNRCAVEATGGYEQLVAEYFYSSGIILNIINPARIRKYAQGIGIIAKTDRIDAYVIERYAREVKPKTNFIAEKSLVDLKRLVTRRAALKNIIIAEKNRKRIAQKNNLKSIKRVINFLEKEVGLIEKSIYQILEENKDLKNKVNVLTTQKGIGKMTACYLAGLIPELGLLNKQQAAALSGLAPFSRDSGKIKGKRYIQAGRSLARKALYMPAWIAVMYDQKLKIFYNRLVGKGKPPKVAIVAVMRKMIIQANKNLKIYYQNL